jgi:hypothetical protein
MHLIAKHRPIDDAFEFYTYGGGTIPPRGWRIALGESYWVKTGGGAFWWP